jgi:hypothetical protein
MAAQGNASTRIITYTVTAVYGAVITLNGADYIRIKNLTIKPTGTSYGYGFLFTNSADYNEVSDCVINLPPTAPRRATIRAFSETIRDRTGGTSGDWGNYNLIKDNTITGGY